MLRAEGLPPQRPRLFKNSKLSRIFSGFCFTAAAKKNHINIISTQIERILGEAIAKLA
jgi:hypothetical protein